MSAGSTLTAQRIRELFVYDPLTGAFTRRIRAGGCVAGTPAGKPNGNGYLRIHVDGKNYYAHRLAWLYVTGEWPVAMIDHRDGERSNNRFANLREASPRLNSQNRRVSRISKTGVLGAWPDQGGFAARIRLPDGTRKRLGRHATPEAAGEVYRRAKAEFA